MKRWSVVGRACEAADRHRWIGRRQSGDGGAGLSSAVLALLVTGPLVVLAVWFVTGALVRAGPPDLGDPVQVSGAPTAGSSATEAQTPPPVTGQTTGRTTPPADSTASSPANDVDASGAAAVTGAPVCPAGVDVDGADPGGADPGDDDPGGDDPGDGDPDDDRCED
jgi:hypothetical protein